MAHGIPSFVIAVIALLITTDLSVTWDRQKLRAHPVNSLFSILLITGLLVPLSRRLFDRYEARTAQYLPVAASGEDALDDDDGQDHEEAESFGLYAPVSPLGPRTRRHLFVGILASVIVRTALLLHVEINTQCSYSGVEVALLPILLFIYDFMICQKSWIIEKEDADEMSNSAFEDMYSSLCYTRSRYLIPTALFSLGVFMTICVPHSSSYICPTSGSGLPIFTSQIISTSLDAIIILAASRLLKDGHKDKQKANIVGIVSLFSAGSIAVSGLAYLAFTDQISRVIVLDSAYLWTLLTTGIACTILLICLEQLIQVVRPLTLTTLFLFCSAFAHLVFTARASRDMFPVRWKSLNIFGMLFLYIGLILGMSFYKNTESKNNFARRVPMWFYTMLGIGFVLAECFYVSAPRYVGFSPINYLMYEAQIAATAWTKQASKSNTLEAAVVEYHRRYSRSPPPNFDKWLSFAAQRRAYVIDDYDDIESNLLPFWAISPAEVRSLTTNQDSNYGIVAMSIRQSRVVVGNISSSEAIWVQEAGKLIERFSQWLPDMDISFNIQKEPQVAVTLENIEALLKEGKQFSEKAATASLPFSQSANPPWSGFDPDSSLQYGKRLNHVPGYDKVDVFSSVVAPLCPSGSLARKGRLWNHGSFCAACARPHAIGLYIQNWTIAGDLCHQPDMASYHDYMMSSVLPKALPRKSLVPIFSRYTIPGFNDILFPGPGTYLQPPSASSAAAPQQSDLLSFNDSIPFTFKKSSLFWRDALDGTIADSSWKGTQAQRFVHIINNSTSHIPLLLPSPSRLTYRNVPAAKVRCLITTNVSFTHAPSCPSTSSCPAQIREFGTTTDPIPMTEWFQNRYLFSTDASISTSTSTSTSTAPTLLQILASNSLPFHASLYRQWYTSRLTPWLHFIPLDLRFQGLFATLAYFTGLKSNDDDAAGDASMNIPGKTDQANFMARAGREWVESAVRREDAEVYIFRLLLEWGRVVDDKREQVGFVLPDGEAKAPS